MRVEDMFLIWFSLLVILIPFYVVAVGSGMIIIQKDFGDEYEKCKLELERTQPICPACECDGSLWPTLFAIIPMLFMIAFLSYTTGKVIEQKKQELKKKGKKK